jgi:ATP-binding cassette, subfamily B, bacterial PglK
MSSFESTRKLVHLLTPHERRRGLQVLAFMLGMAVFETVGIASILPFLAVAGNPELVEANSALNFLYGLGGFRSVDSFLFALGIAAFLVVVISSGLRAVTRYVIHRYTQMRRYTLSARLLQSYLRQPYGFFLNRNTAHLAKSVLSEVDSVVTQVLKPGMEVISYGLIAFMLVALLFAVDPVLAFVIAGVMGGIYSVVYAVFRGRLRRLGQARVLANRARFQAASEAFGGIKDLKVLGREQAYLRRYRKPAKEFARVSYVHNALAATPRYLIEATAFGGILALTLTLMATRENMGDVLPLLGLYAFGGYRLLPAAEHIYTGITTIRFGWPAVESLYDDLTASRPAPDDALPGETLTLASGIRFQNVSFGYPGANGHVLKGLDFMIPALTSVALVGRTGSGKTTAVDLILGLLEPSEGQILVDGTPLREIGIRNWQKAVGYVPQSIYLADASVADNIAFGISRADIDRAAVERAARIANLHDFVVGELPAGYDTEVGDRGIRLSGGQRQRIGIARALYHDPTVLVLDEATSALDAATERAIMEAVERLSGEKTIIMIAHRMTTVERCDRIVVLDRGEVKGIGTCDDLKQSNPTFRRLAAVR